MSEAPNYTYTAEQITAAFTEIKTALFKDITADPVPKMLVVAGLQGSGKTWLLEKTCWRLIATPTMYGCTCLNTGKNTRSTRT